ncbi:hypothetical protein PHMEG_00013556 [Phytophthora megakarya]|uniref:Eukaryotic/viral aspartic protease n=1 Tax=Phytophthora megakarya TaxID=4795 RepID=A0A225W6H7_9STRA|nr:hypothetical protein PHMEG_00013556 [Phytophthora megakarya]
MGIATHAYPFKVPLDYWSPSEAGAEQHKWKENLKTAFDSQGSGVRRQPVSRAIGESVNPANIPLPQIPKKKRKPITILSGFAHGDSSFSKSPNSRHEGFEELDVDLHDDKFKTIAYLTANIMIQMASEEMETITRQIRDWYDMESENSTPIFKIAPHRPLGKIVPFEGKLDESEIALQWLRGFVCEITLRLMNGMELFTGTERYHARRSVIGNY